MKARRALFISVCLLISSAALAQSPQTQQRIVSTSLCGDSYVRASFPDAHIAALSWQSRSALSLASPAERDLPQARPEAESLLALSPDLVVFGPGEGADIAPLLTLAGIESIQLDWAEDEPALLNNMAKLGVIIDPDVPQANFPLRPKVLYLSRAGGTAGTGTFIDAAITRAGGQNIWTQPGWFTPDAETLFTLKPDLIVTSFNTGGYDSAQDKIGHHHAYDALLERVPHIDIPGNYWPCMNPDYIQAVALIADGVQAVTAQSFRDWMTLPRRLKRVD